MVPPSPPITKFEKTAYPAPAVTIGLLVISGYPAGRKLFSLVYWMVWIPGVKKPNPPDKRPAFFGLAASCPDDRTGTIAIIKMTDKRKGNFAFITF
jgi:hypothetical protein